MARGNWVVRVALGIAIAGMAWGGVQLMSHPAPSVTTHPAAVSSQSR